MVPFRGNLILSRAVPVPRAKQAAPPGSQAPAPTNGRMGQIIPRQNPALTCPCILTQSNSGLLVIQGKRGEGLVRHPLADYRKKEIPGFPLLQAVQTAPEFAQKGRSHGAARAHSKTKLLRSKNGVPHYSVRDIG